MSLTATRLPPLPSVFTPVKLREGGDALARAVVLAPGEGPAQGAGTLVWVGALAGTRERTGTRRATPVEDHPLVPQRTT